MSFSERIAESFFDTAVGRAPPKRIRSGSRGVAQTADKRLIPIDSRSIFCAETESEKFSKINLRTKSKKGK